MSASHLYTSQTVDDDLEIIVTQCKDGYYIGVSSHFGVTASGNTLTEMIDRLTAKIEEQAA